MVVGFAYLPREFAQCLVSRDEGEVIRMVCMLCYSLIFPPVPKKLRP